jgi:hypothetical protein
MMPESYLNEAENQKCQCITFDENGRVMGSNDTLFPAVKLTLARMKSEFPFLWKVIRYLKTCNEQPDPLFFPQVEFEISGYRNVCDFTFMQSEDAKGIKRFICMIYDNSIHYRHIIQHGYSGKAKKYRLTF